MIKYKKWAKNFISNLGVIRILKKIKEYSAQKRIDKAEIVHIMFNDKFNKPFVDLLNRNFDNSKHLILCKKVSKCKVRPFPKGTNVIKIGDVRNIDLSSEKIKKIICHSLFMPDLVKKLYNEPKLLEKSYWVMWGGDLYEADRDEENDFVRKNFKGYINDADMDYAIEKYGMKCEFYKAFYNFPISKTMLDSIQEPKKSYLQIQINNSCDRSTLEILDMLHKYKNEKIKIYTILSYGDLEYKNYIIKKGIECFGNKFEYIEEMMPPEHYAQHLSQNDILILNQGRQQGFGNTIASLYLGKKVFIREETSINKYLNNENIKVFNTQDIADMDITEFQYYGEKQETIANVSKYLEEQYLVKLWSKIFV